MRKILLSLFLITGFNLSSQIRVPSYQKKLIIDANSLCELGEGNVRHGHRVWQYIDSAAVKKPPIFDYSIQGRTTPTITASFSTVVQPYVRSGDVIILWEGTNDLQSGSTPAQCVTNLIAYSTQARALGLKVYVLTVIPRNNAHISEANRLTLNISLISNSASFDGVIDVASMSQFDAYADVSNTTYYNADLVHLTRVGYNLIAAFILNVIQPLFTYNEAKIINLYTNKEYIQKAA